jgi:hypothetical protein
VILIRDLEVGVNSTGTVEAVLGLYGEKIRRGRKISKARSEVLAVHLEVGSGKGFKELTF